MILQITKVDPYAQEEAETQKYPPHHLPFQPSLIIDSPLPNELLVQCFRYIN